MDIKEKLKALPDSPGVYLMKNKDGNVIYIGKAVSLRKRVASYFKKETSSYRTDVLRSNIADIDYIKTGSEEEALLLEAALIKEKQPKFNVLLKDDKRYPLLKLSLNEKFPRLVIVRRKKKDKAIYFGPYTNAKLLRKALGIMRKIFPLRTCNVMPKAPCLNYHIGQCIAPCLYVSQPYQEKAGKDIYGQVVGDVTLFLKGKKEELVKKLSLRMKDAAFDKNFEEAARLRDQIQALSVIGGKWKKQELFLAERIEGFDISNISGREAVGSMVSFLNGRPDKSNYRRYKIKTVLAVDDYKMIEEILMRRYKKLLAGNLPLPDLVLIDGGKGHVGIARSVLDRLGLNKIKTLGIAKKEETIFSEFGQENVSDDFKKLFQHIRDEAHRFAQNYHHILRRKKVLGK